MITVARIIDATAAEFGLSDLLARDNQPSISEPRQIAMLLARELTGHSLPTLGRIFKRDHTTVLHGIRAAEKRIAESTELAQSVRKIKEALMPLNLVCMGLEAA